MLFLLNDVVTDIAAPEMRLLHRQPAFRDDVLCLTASEALALARQRLQALHDRGLMPADNLIDDLAALIISRTGANAAFFPVSGRRVGEARLGLFPEIVLQGLLDRRRRAGGADQACFWMQAA